MLEALPQGRGFDRADLVAWLDRQVGRLIEDFEAMTASRRRKLKRIFESR